MTNLTIETDPADGSPTPSGGAARGNVRRWLRLEGLAILAVTVIVYGHRGNSRLLFLILFLAPDLSFLAYALGPRIGAAIYNIAHSYILPLILGCCLWFAGHSLAIPLIWIAHIALDRALGYGLKYPTRFADTHLGRLGRDTAEAGSP
jgi:hypothetical protein